MYKKNLLNKITLIGFILMIFISCSKKESTKKSTNTDKIIISVSILPQKFFVEKIGGDKVEVNTLIPNGASPALYEPNPLQMKELEKSLVYFKVGHPNFPFEKKFFDDIASNKDNLLSVDMFAGVDFRNFKKPHNHSHDHDVEDFHDDKKHSKSEKEIHTDSHVWTSTGNVKIAALNILTTLSKIDTKNESFYENNYKKFIKEIDLLQLKIRDIFKNKKEIKFLVFHPSWGYFADEFNLEQISVEVDGKKPSAKSLMNVIKTAKENNIKVIFVQEGFSKSSAEVIANELGATVTSISPLEENWLNNLEIVAKKIRN